MILQGLVGIVLHNPSNWKWNEGTHILLGNRYLNFTWIVHTNCWICIIVTQCTYHILITRPIDIDFVKNYANQLAVGHNYLQAICRAVSPLRSCKLILTISPNTSRNVSSVLCSRLRVISWIGPKPDCLRFYTKEIYAMCDAEEYKITIKAN